MHSRSFLHHAFVYGFGAILIQAAGFLLVPLYTRCLTPEQYGKLEILSRIGDVVLICLVIGGIRQATLAFYNQSKDSARRQRVVGTAILLAAVFAFLACILMMALANLICALLHIASVYLFRLASLSIALDIICLLLLALMQARLESRLFVTATVAQF